MVVQHHNCHCVVIIGILVLLFAKAAAALFKNFRRKTLGTILFNF